MLTFRAGTVLAAAVIVTLGALAPASAQTGTTAVTTGPLVVSRGVDVAEGTPPPPVPATSFGSDRSAAATASFQLTFDPAFPVAAQPAAQAAAGILSNLVTSSVPIHVQVNYTAQPAGSTGFASTNATANFAGAPVTNTWYPTSLAEALNGGELSAGAEITVNMAQRGDWYFGTDGNTPASSFDMETIFMHELIHGLGFVTSFTVSGGSGSWGQGAQGYPFIYDRFVEDQSGTRLLNTATYPNPSAALANALTSGSLYFDSPQTNRSNTDRVRLESQPTWTQNRSVIHWEESTYTGGSANALMTPVFFTGESDHSPGPLALCALEALGWTTPVDCTPPARTQVIGFGWFSDGGSAKTGPAGTVALAYGTGLKTSTNYQLITGLDGGPDFPCMWEVATVNPNTRRSSTSGFIGNTAGAVNRASGRWQLCFREIGAGSTLAISAPLTFTVT